jgi:hypothetical protein
MVVAKGQILTAGKGAELIRTKTGRSCTRQNLENLCKKGRLPHSTVSAAPVRVIAELLVAEYMSSVDPRQSVRERPGIAQAVLDAEPPRPAPPRPATPPPVPVPPDELPDYTESKKKTEYEKGLILELERKQKEGTLLDREEVERSWANAIGRVKSRILATASAAKQRIPHLDPEEVEILKDMLREALFELAAEGER